MTTPEEELEAEVWQQLTAMICQQITQGEFVDAVVLAAQRYAAGDSEIVTVLRRAVLHRERDDWGGDTTAQTSASTRGGDARAAPELHPPGSGAGPQEVGDGGATPSTGASIPESVTRRDVALSTGVEAGYPQGAS